MSKLSILAAKTSFKLLSLVGRGGSMPGTIALKVDPNSLSKLHFRGPVILVTGTNGKTSTANMISSLFEKAGKNTDAAKPIEVSYIGRKVRHTSKISAKYTFIFQNGKVLCERESGFADLPNEIPNTLETKFASASAGKVFVAVGILQLIKRGKIKFDDTLGVLLDIPLNEIDKDVTVKQLLNHTSGVPDYFDESVMDEYEELWIDYPNYKIRHNSDLLPLFINKPMMYPKGKKFQYNNSGYVLLAMVIEKVMEWILTNI